MAFARDDRAGRASNLREEDRDAIDPIPMGQDQAREQAFESNRWN
jgi:hypothetical protein